MSKFWTPSLALVLAAALAACSGAAPSSAFNPAESSMAKTPHAQTCTNSHSLGINKTAGITFGGHTTCNYLPSGGISTTATLYYVATGSGAGTGVNAVSAVSSTETNNVSKTIACYGHAAGHYYVEVAANVGAVVKSDHIAASGC